MDTGLHPKCADLGLHWVFVPHPTQTSQMGMGFFSSCLMVKRALQHSDIPFWTGVRTGHNSRVRVQDIPQPRCPFPWVFLQWRPNNLGNWVKSPFLWQLWASPGRLGTNVSTPSFPFHEHQDKDKPEPSPSFWLTLKHWQYRGFFFSCVKEYALKAETKDTGSPTASQKIPAHVQRKLMNIAGSASSSWRSFTPFPPGFAFINQIQLPATHLQHPSDRVWVIFELIFKGFVSF